MNGAEILIKTAVKAGIKVCFTNPGTTELPLVCALDSVAGAAGNYVYFEATKKIQLEVTTGNALANSMENANVFPSMVIQMVAIGEESGALDTIHVLALGQKIFFSIYVFLPHAHNHLCPVKLDRPGRRTAARPIAHPYINIVCHRAGCSILRVLVFLVNCTVVLAPNPDIVAYVHRPS